MVQTRNSVSQSPSVPSEASVSVPAAALEGTTAEEMHRPSQDGAIAHDALVANPLQTTAEPPIEGAASVASVTNTAEHAVSPSSGKQVTIYHSVEDWMRELEVVIARAGLNLDLVWHSQVLYTAFTQAQREQYKARACPRPTRKVLGKGCQTDPPRTVRARCHFSRRGASNQPPSFLEVAQAAQDEAKGYFYQEIYHDGQSLDDKQKIPANQGSSQSAPGGGGKASGNNGNGAPYHAKPKDQNQFVPRQQWQKTGQQVVHAKKAQFNKPSAATQTCKHCLRTAPANFDMVTTHVCDAIMRATPPATHHHPSPHRKLDNRAPTARAANVHHGSDLTGHSFVDEFAGSSNAA
ncbi:hypothetical protein BC940DRAFT_320973 [Gongronella butleri]|nr:hypothetical protein BC940DRAFT_320973 [Gongronella butleri]